MWEANPNGENPRNRVGTENPCRCKAPVWDEFSDRVHWGERQGKKLLCPAGHLHAYFGLAYRNKNQCLRGDHDYVTIPNSIVYIHLYTVEVTVIIICELRFGRLKLHTVKRTRRIWVYAWTHYEISIPTRSTLCRLQQDTVTAIIGASGLRNYPRSPAKQSRRSLCRDLLSLIKRIMLRTQSTWEMFPWCGSF